MPFFSWFSKSPKVEGPTNRVVAMALAWVEDADKKFVTNSEKRLYVLKMLMSKGMSESAARLATEIAIQYFKKSKHA